MFFYCIIVDKDHHDPRKCLCLLLQHETNLAGKVNENVLTLAAIVCWVCFCMVIHGALTFLHHLVNV